MAYKKMTGNVRPQLRHAIITFSFILSLTSSPFAAHAQVECGDTIGPNETAALDDDLVCDNDTGGIRVVGPATLDLAGHGVFCADTNADIVVPVEGLLLEGKKAHVRDGFIEGCVIGVAVSGDGQHTVEHVDAIASFASGFQIRSDRNTVMGSLVYSSVAGPGFSVSGNKNALLRNTAEQNTIGFRVDGNQNKLTQNTAENSIRPEPIGSCGMGI